MMLIVKYKTREKLKRKAKIKSRVYIQLGEEALQIVQKTFAPDIAVILHLLALANNTIDTNIPPHCMLYRKASIACQLLTISLQVLQGAFRWFLPCLDLLPVVLLFA